MSSRWPVIHTFAASLQFPMPDYPSIREDFTRLPDYTFGQPERWSIERKLHGKRDPTYPLPEGLIEDGSEDDTGDEPEDIWYQGEVSLALDAQGGYRQDGVAYHAMRGPLRLVLYEDYCVIRLSIASLTDALYPHDPRLLCPAACARAIDVLDLAIKPLHVPPLRLWRVRRLDYAYDVEVKPEDIDCYLDSFSRREVRQRGRRAEHAGYRNGTVYWKWDDRLRQVMLYAKHRELEDRYLSVDLPDGTLRFEVSYRERGCNKLADDSQLKPDPVLPNYLMVAATLDPDLAYRVLSRYLGFLDATAAIPGKDDALARIVEKHPTKRRAPVLYTVHSLLSEGWSRPTIERWLGQMGYKDAQEAFSDCLRELSSAGIVPGVARAQAIPGLSLPTFGEFQNLGLADPGAGFVPEWLVERPMPPDPLVIQQLRARKAAASVVESPG